MLPAFLAEAQNIGGNRLMFLTVPILGGVALLAFYLLATRLLQHPLAALGATATLALLMPQVSFSRDSTTEIPIQLLLFTALWLLCDRRTLRRPRPAFVAGLLLGLVQAMHVDGLAFLVGLPAVFAITWLHTNRGRPRPLAARDRVGERRRRRSGSLLGALDLFRWDRSYLSVVRGNVERLAAVEIVAIVAAVGVVVLVRRAATCSTRSSGRGASTANVAGVLVLIGGFGAWFVRPHVQHVHAAAATRPSPSCSGSTTSPIDGHEALRRALGAVDQLVRRADHADDRDHRRRRAHGRARARLAAAPDADRDLHARTAGAALHLAPDDHTRPDLGGAPLPARGVPRGHPARVRGALRARARARSAGSSVSGARSAIVLAIATVVFPWLTIRNVSQMTEQRGLFPVITVGVQDPRSRRRGRRAPGRRTEVGRVPERPADLALVLQRPRRGDARPTRRRPCCTRSRRNGRRRGAGCSWSPTAPQTISRVLPHADLRPTGRRINPHFLEQTLTRRPSKYTPEALPADAWRRSRGRGTAITPAPIGARLSADRKHLGAATLLDQRHVRLERGSSVAASVRSTTRPLLGRHVRGHREANDVEAVVEVEQRRPTGTERGERVDVLVGVPVEVGLVGLDRRADPRDAVAFSSASSASATDDAAASPMNTSSGERRLFASSA